MLILYFVFVHLSLLIPGYTAISMTRLFRDKPAVELLLAYTLSIVFSALLAVIGYAFDAPAASLQIVHWLVLGVGFFFFLKKKLYRNLATHRFPLLVLAGMSLFTLLIISLSFTGPRPFYPDPEFRAENNYSAFTVKVLNVAQTNANDNYIPYRQAQFIVNNSDPAKDSFINEWGVHFFQRTPLLGAVTAEYFTLFDDQPPIAYTWSTTGQDPDQTYMKFQIIAHILNSLFVLPAFYLLLYLFNRKTAKISLLFILTSQYFLFNTFFSWPKSLVAFFILASWLFIFEKRLRLLILAAAMSGLAYLAHDLAVLYMGATVLLLLYYRRFRDIFVFGLVSALFALPWFLASALMYKKPSTFIYYPLSLQGIPQIEQKQAIVHEFFNTSPLRIIAIKLESLFYLLSPYQLLYSEGGQAAGRRLWALGLFSMPGAIGLGLIGGAVGGVVRHIRNIPLWILSLVPIVLCTIIIGWPKGLGALHFAQASVVLLMGLGVAFFVSLKGRWWILAAYVLHIVQLVFFVVYSFNFRIGSWFTNTQDILLLCLIALTITVCGILAHRTASQQG